MIRLNGNFKPLRTPDGDPGDEHDACDRRPSFVFSTANYSFTTHINWHIKVDRPVLPDHDPGDESEESFDPFQNIRFAWA